MFQSAGDWPEMPEICRRRTADPDSVHEATAAELAPLLERQSRLARLSGAIREFNEIVGDSPEAPGDDGLRELKLAVAIAETKTTLVALELKLAAAAGADSVPAIWSKVLSTRSTLAEQQAAYFMAQYHSDAVRKLDQRKRATVRRKFRGGVLAAVRRCAEMQRSLAAPAEPGSSAPPMPAGLAKMCRDLERDLDPPWPQTHMQDDLRVSMVAAPQRLIGEFAGSQAIMMIPLQGTHVPYSSETCVVLQVQGALAASVRWFDAQGRAIEVSGIQKDSGATGFTAVLAEPLLAGWIVVDGEEVRILNLPRLTWEQVAGRSAKAPTSRPFNPEDLPPDWDPSALLMPEKDPPARLEQAREAFADAADRAAKISKLHSMEAAADAELRSANGALACAFADLHVAVASVQAAEAQGPDAPPWPDALLWARVHHLRAKAQAAETAYADSARYEWKLAGGHGAAAGDGETPPSAEQIRLRRQRDSLWAQYEAAHRFALSRESPAGDRLARRTAAHGLLAGELRRRGLTLSEAEGDFLLQCSTAVATLAASVARGPFDTASTLAVSEQYPLVVRFVPDEALSAPMNSNRRLTGSLDGRTFEIVYSGKLSPRITGSVGDGAVRIETGHVKVSGTFVSDGRTLQLRSGQMTLTTLDGRPAFSNDATVRIGQTTYLYSDSLDVWVKVPGKSEL